MTTTPPPEDPVLSILEGLEAGMEEEGWDLRPRLLLLTLESEPGAEMRAVELPVPDKHMTSVNGNVVTLLAKYAAVMELTGRLLPEWPMVESNGRSRPVAFGGIVTTSEGWGLTGEAAARVAAQQRAGRRTVAMRDRPDREEMRSVAAFTVLNVLSTTVRIRDKEPVSVVLDEDSPDYPVAMEGPGNAAMRDFTATVKRIYARFGIEW